MAQMSIEVFFEGKFTIQICTKIHHGTQPRAIMQHEGNFLLPHDTAVHVMPRHVGGASGVEQAVGRVVGTMCVVTGRDEDAESAMLASWVSQVCSTNVDGFCVCRHIRSLCLNATGITTVRTTADTKTVVIMIITMFVIRILMIAINNT